MPLPLEEYAVLGDLQTAALVGSNGSVDWLCFPRFDSGSVFAALLGTEQHGHWQLAPTGPVRATRRRYRPDTLVLETEFDTDEGTVRVVDFMPVRGEAPDLVRIVEGVRGSVPMRMQLRLRFDYGHIIPWVRRAEDGLLAVAGPDAVRLQTPVDLRGEDLATVAEFTARQGTRTPFVLTWYPSHRAAPGLVDADAALAETESWWREWAGRCTYDGPWREAVVRSLITLKAMIYAPTGGIVAAVTTSVPEQLGGVRNWDYRYCWLRDATMTLQSMLYCGYSEEAEDWRRWLLRAVAGDPADLQIMYGLAGERRLEEYVVDWLPGYDGGPVRIGNAAVGQFQLDVYGEVMDALHLARTAGLQHDADAWALQRHLVAFVEEHWRDPDEGLWEVRGPAQHFTHSKLMAWVALDRAVKAVEGFGLQGPVDRWRVVREEVRRDVESRGFDRDRGTFTQYYGSAELDAAVLMMPLVGFLPPGDPRVQGTIAAIERELMREGFLQRYTQLEGADGQTSVDGLPPGEGAFLACTFWLADAYAMCGRRDDARRTFERLLDLRTDLGLLAEEYDVDARRLVGNFPQAFSHVPLIDTARHLAGAQGGPQRPTAERTR